MTPVLVPLADHLFVALGALLSYRQRELLQAALAIIGLLAIIVVGIYGGWRLHRYNKRKAEERTREIQAALGPAFTLTDATPAWFFLELLRHTSKTLRGQGIRHLKNRFQGNILEGQSMQLVEAGFDVSTGKGGHYTVWQTIAHIGQRDWHFPPFSITPRGWLSRLGLGRRGLVFESHPQFGQLYKVRCEDEAAARVFITGSLLDALSRNPGLTIEGRGNNLLIFRRKKMLPAAQFPAFQAEARQLAAQFPQTVGQPTPPPTC